jgi:zinc transporter 1/2/3
MIGLKLLFVAAVLAAAALGGAIPLRRHGDMDGGRLLSWGNAFAAGVFLGAGLIHMLPDASGAWSALGWDYPMAFLLAAGGFVLMLLFEHVLPPESAHEMVHAPSTDRFTHLPEHDHGGSGAAAYTVLTALSVHSLFAGLALGAEPELAGALVIFVAVIAHKSTAAFALGVSLVRNRLTRARAWGLLALFSLATPLGILVGTVLGEVLEGPTSRLFEATFLALAAGTFVYVATLDILRDEFVEPGGRLTKRLLVSGGAGLMGILAIWV